jgi:hypothetical protein
MISVCIHEMHELERVIYHTCKRLVGGEEGGWGRSFMVVECEWDMKNGPQTKLYLDNNIKPYFDSLH